MKPKYGQSTGDDRLKEVTVALDAFETELAATLGDGDLGLGLRRGLVLASLRSEVNPTRTHEKMKTTGNPLTIVTDQMAALAEELKQTGEDPRRREEIALQITKLGKLYLTIRAGADSSETDL